MSAGLGRRVARVAGLGTIASCLAIAMGAQPSQAQIVSSVTFNFLGSPTTDPNYVTSTTTAGGTQGTVTYVGTGNRVDGLAGNDFFLNVTGIQFATPPAFAWNGVVPNPSTYNSFSSFYLVGTCPICFGQANQQLVTIDDPSASGLTTLIPTQTGGVVTNSAGPINITYGNSGAGSGNRGTITFFAQSLVAGDLNAGVGSGIGTIGLSVIQTSGVPGPLPILGASTAFAFSRRLRRRVASARAASPSA